VERKENASIACRVKTWRACDIRLCLAGSLHTCVTFLRGRRFSPCSRVLFARHFSERKERPLAVKRGRTRANAHLKSPRNRDAQVAFPPPKNLLHCRNYIQEYWFEGEKATDNSMDIHQVEPYLFSILEWHSHVILLVFRFLLLGLYWKKKFAENRKN